MNLQKFDNSVSFSDYLRQEKCIVKNALCLPMKQGSIWELINMQWFNRWKKYVQYDEDNSRIRSREEISINYPGEISNLILKGRYIDEINENVEHNIDFVLVPKVIASLLFSKYDGGPRYQRYVINFGSIDKPILKVNIFPQRLNIFICNHNNPMNEIWEEESNIHINPIVKYYSNVVSVGDLINQLRELTTLNHSNFRVWNKALNISNFNSHKLTSDKVLYYNNWRLLFDKSIQLTDLQLLDGSIILLLEEYPRDKYINHWKRMLSIDDEIDCLNQFNYWKTGKIVQINNNKILIQINDNDLNYIEEIPFDMITNRIEPLYSKSLNKIKHNKNIQIDIKQSNENSTINQSTEKNDDNNKKIANSTIYNKKRKVVHKLDTTPNKKLKSNGDTIAVVTPTSENNIKINQTDNANNSNVLTNDTIEKVINKYNDIESLKLNYKKSKLNIQIKNHNDFVDLQSKKIHLYEEKLKLMECQTNWEIQNDIYKNLIALSCYDEKNKYIDEYKKFLILNK